MKSISREGFRAKDGEALAGPAPGENDETSEPIGRGALRQAQGLEQAKRVETVVACPGKMRE